MKTLPPNLVRLASRVFEQPLMIERGKARTILAALWPKFGLPESCAPESQRGGARARDRDSLNIEDGIAVIDVFGTLVQRATGLDALSGLTSYEALDAEFQEALERSDVRGILFKVDSPGGEATGVFDLADRILAARGTKPIWAVAEDHATSAAYLIGASADRFVVTQSAVVGSIGVVLERLDWTAANEAEGVIVHEIFAGARKVDTNPNVPLDPEKEAALQSFVNDFYDLFVSSVEARRDLSGAQVRATDAGIFVGQEAVEMGLADQVMRFDEARGALAAETNQGRAMMAEKTEKLTAEQVKTEAPEVVLALQTEAASSERARILAIHALPVKTDDERELQAKWMADPAMDQGKAAAALLTGRAEREKTQKAGALAALKEDEAALKPPTPSTDPDASSEEAVVQRVLNAGLRPAKKTA